MRTPLLAIALGLSLAGCGNPRKEPHSYTAHKRNVEQADLYRDQRTVRNIPGVNDVIATRDNDGTGILRVETTAKASITVREKLAELGYAIATH